MVASVAHTYESTAVEFPDGRLAISVLGSHFRPDTLRTDEQSLSYAAHVRLQDLSSVLDELQRLNDRHGVLISGKLDLRHVAIMGHSLGGIAAITSVIREPRFVAAIVLDAPRWLPQWLELTSRFSSWPRGEISGEVVTASSGAAYRVLAYSSTSAERNIWPPPMRFGSPSNFLNWRHMLAPWARRRRSPPCEIR